MSCSLTVQPCDVQPLEEERNIDANCMEKTGFLEAQSRREAEHLDTMKAKWEERATKMKTMYDEKLTEKVNKLDTIMKNNARFEIEETSLEEKEDELLGEIDGVKERLEEIQNECKAKDEMKVQYEAEIKILRSRMNSLTEEGEHNKKKIDHLKKENDEVNLDLDQESMKVIALEDKIYTQKDVHQKKLKELILHTFRDTTEENHKVWKNETADSLRTIEDTYNEQLKDVIDQLDPSCDIPELNFSSEDTRQKND